LAGDGLGERVTAHPAVLTDRHQGERNVWHSGMKAFEQEPSDGQWRLPPWRRVALALRGQKQILSKSRVIVTSIDHFVAEHGLVPGVIKIDVDGYEGRVLRGGLGTFTSHKPAIALELHKDRKLRFGDTRQGVVRMMTDLGYKALFLTDHHDRKACRVVEVDSAHPLIARQETDFIILC